MIEAFEIGVSLALQDGVSEAIEKARRDVAALESAVHESGVSAQSLREVGDRVSSVSFGDRPRLVAEKPVKPVVPDAAPRVEKEVQPAPFVALLGAIQMTQAGEVAQDALLPRIERGAPETEFVAPQSAKAALQPDVDAPQREFTAPQPAIVASEPAMVAPTPAVVVPQPGIIATVTSNPTATRPQGVVNFFVADTTPGVAERAPESPSPPVAPLAVFELSDSSEGVPAANGGGAPPVVVLKQANKAERAIAAGVVAQPGRSAAPLLSQEQKARDFPPPTLSALAPDQGSGRALGDVSLLSALRLSGGSVAAPQEADQDMAQAGSMPVAADDGVNELARLAPVVTPRVHGAPPPREITASGATAEMGAPQAESPAAGPNAGDVFLDGMLVGRWMSRFLNREAERASAGPTGFDARRGRLLPGVTVGG